jgi:hypothetical protein
MSAGRYVGIDLGELVIKIATGDEPYKIPAPDGGPVAALRVALARVSARAEICVAVPDAWLSGEASGAVRQEEVRHVCETLARQGPVGWVGQLAAVSAFAAASRGQGRYLVCDIGGTGVRAGAFSVSSGTVRVGPIHAEAGGGWREFDAAIRAALPPGQAAGLPVDWYEQAKTREKKARAVLVLEEATTGSDDALDTRLYRIAGADGDIAVKAGVVINSFAPTQRRLQTVIAAVSGDTRLDYVVLTGTLNWLPLATSSAVTAAGLGRTGSEAADAKLIVLDPDAAARGALLFVRGEAHLAPPEGREALAVPVYRIRDGLLEGVSVTLPWTGSYATFPGGDPMVDNEELQVLVAGRPHVASLRGIVPGPHQIGVRPAWPGSGVLVVRPTVGQGAPHVIPLADLAAQ